MHWYTCKSLLNTIGRVYTSKAVDKWVLGDAEAPLSFWPFYVKGKTQHTTANDMQ